MDSLPLDNYCIGLIKYFVWKDRLDEIHVILSKNLQWKTKSSNYHYYNEYRRHTKKLGRRKTRGFQLRIFTRCPITGKTVHKYYWYDSHNCKTGPVTSSIHHFYLDPLNEYYSF